MAITQVANPSSVPEAIADYEAQNAHISAFNNIVNNQPFILTNSGGTGLPAIKVGTYIQYGGNLYVVDTEDYAITGTPVDGNNYIRLSGSTTLTAEWIQDISGYAWNEVYGYKESGSYFLLPYLVIKDDTEYEKYSMGAITAQYKMNQNVRTTDSPTFANITSSAGMIGTYKSGTVWATYGSITENDVFDNFSFIPLGATIIASGMFGDASYDYTMVAIQRSDANNIILHRHKAGDNTISTTTCTDGDATEVARWVNISY